MKNKAENLKKIITFEDEKFQNYKEENCKLTVKIARRKFDAQSKFKIVGCSETAEKIFHKIFPQNKFIYHSTIIEANKVIIVGYSYDIDGSGLYIDPWIEINDNGLIKCSIGLLGKENVNNFIKDAISSKLEEYNLLSNTPLENYL